MTATTKASETARPTPRWRRELQTFAELFALCGFAIAQPLLDLFGRNPSQFAFHSATSADVWQWALVVTFTPPLVLWVMETIVGLIASKARAPLHLALVGVLVAMFTVQLARNLVPGPLLLALAIGAGIGAAVLRQRVAAVRLWLAYAAVAPLVFLGLFLYTSDTAKLLTADESTASDVVVENPPPVVMLVFDEFPLTSIIDADGSIDAELYPNIAALAAESHWFRNTTTPSSSTFHAVPSIVTGRYPEEGTAPVAADHPDNLFTLLGNTYEMRVTESVTRLCAQALCEPTTSGEGALRALLRDALDATWKRLSLAEDDSDPVAELSEQPAQDENTVQDNDTENGFDDFALNQPARFETLIDGLDGDPATLHYLHLLLPHVAYRYLPSGVIYDSPEPDIGRIGDDWTDEEWPPQLARQRLQLQVAYVDELVGELINTLRQRDMYDEALIVLTSDHGIAFQPGNPIRGLEGQEIDDTVLPELAWVPFMLKEPGQQGGTVSDANVQTVDIVPTIADVLDVELPWQADGQSALGPPRPDNHRPFYPATPNAFGFGVADPIDIDGDELWPHVLEEAVDRVLPPVGTPDRLWRIGPRSALVGTDVDDAPRNTLAPVEARLDDQAAYRDVDLASGRAPALVRGSLPDEDEDEGLIAVAVNGVIGATARTYREDDTVRFAVMVSDARLRDGPNEIVVYRVR